MSTDCNSFRLAGLLGLCLAASTGPSVAAETLSEAFTEGDFAFAFRWRAEFVKQDGFDHKALAIPLRARLNYGTAGWKGFSLFAEVDYVFDFGVDTYNEGGGNTPDRGDYPVIADPGGADFNQGWLQWKSQQGNQIRGGRQRIIYDNARFIGNVGWRQNEQTYDAVSFERKAWRNLDIRAGYIGQVNRIFGNDVPAGQQDMDTWLLNLAYTIENAGKLVGYYYEIDNEDAPGLSNQTFGARFTGQAKGSKVTWGYTAEYARQGETGNNPVPYSADYWRFDLSANLGKWTPYLGYESLGGDNRKPGQAFRTPLATLHAFNGWADKFLATPHAGLVDVFGGAKGKLGNWSWNLLYHDFSAESGSANFGSEIDGSLSTKFGGKLGFLLKAAKFETDSPAYADTFKFWLQFTASF
jgi:hypothetical protein